MIDQFFLLERNIYSMNYQNVHDVQVLHPYPDKDSKEDREFPDYICLQHSSLRKEWFQYQDVQELQDVIPLEKCDAKGISSFRAKSGRFFNHRSVTIRSSGIPPRQRHALWIICLHWYMIFQEKAHALPIDYSRYECSAFCVDSTRSVSAKSFLLL